MIIKEAKILIIMTKIIIIVTIMMTIDEIAWRKKTKLDLIKKLPR